MKLILFTLFACTHAFKVNPTLLTWMKEAEKKHSRAAMIALPSLALIAMTNGQDPVPWLNSQPISTQLSFYSAIGALESLNLKRIKSGITLKEGEVPGKVFPWVKTPTPTLEFLEDTVGRTAMILVTGVFYMSVMGRI